MGKSKDFIKNIDTSLSRRSFIKGTLAVGASATLYGCSKDDDSEIIYQGISSSGGNTSVTVDPIEEATYFYGASTHNCGGRCVSRAEVKNGRIVSILTDEALTAGDGTYLDPESRNLPQTRACARCRAYRYRIYHPGRLRYPMVQTKKRGDLTGFKRISWDEAFRQIAVKHKNVYDKYGLDGIYVLYASAANHGVQGRDTLDQAYRYMGAVYKYYFGSYSTHQNTYFGVNYTGMGPNSITANMVAKYTDYLMLWGDNSPTTRNNNVYGHVKYAEDMKKRNPESKIIFIGPSFSDGGVATADEWVVSKSFTDPALVAGMIYHMLDNTFNLADGSLKSNPWLDVDYLDTMVYGFFDSPEYGLDEATGVIDATSAHAGTRVVSAVPAGRSYCSWILGNNDSAKTYSALGASTNYTAAQFAAGSDMKRWATCSYTATAGASTVYKTKQDFKTPKTPAWASAISGVPEAKIKELAEIWATAFSKGKRVASIWSGGQQKQADGIANLYALQALQIITKNVSEYGTAFSNTIGVSVSNNGDGFYLAGSSFLSTSPCTGVNNRTYPNGGVTPEKPYASCTAWHTTIKATYADELKANGYKARYIPNWAGANNKTITTGDGDIYWDDAGSKAALFKWKRSDGNKVDTYIDPVDGNEYYQWETDASGKPIFAGIRLVYNNAGNIIINQHENSNDSRDMMEHLNLCNYNDADSFCLVTVDNFLSPTARWSDYVLPASTAWEHANFIQPNHSAGFYVPMVSPPPGESKNAWDIANGLLKAAEKTGAAPSGSAKDFTGGTSDMSVETIAKKTYREKFQSNPSSVFYGKTFEEYLKNPYLCGKPNDSAESVPTNYNVKQAFNNLDAAGKMNPFIKTDQSINTNVVTKGGYENTGGDRFADKSDAPVPSLRYQVYSPVLTWQYKHRYSKWHGFYPAEKRGQQHKDFEGDEIVLEIPIYYAYQDYFMEAYGNDPAKVADLGYVLTTTHDRYRSHSSIAENPLLRELNHRVPGRDEKGNFKPCNDYNDYSMGPVQLPEVNAIAEFPPLERTIGNDGSVAQENKDTASYSEIWINKTDGKELIGIQDGDLVQVENPVGAVRCVARLTKRCARGYVDLHQGCWYDPRPIANSYNHEFVDVGGNCNTLMASQPSRYDHGNGQQSAMVKITKVNY